MKVERRRYVTTLAKALRVSYQDWKGNRLPNARFDQGEEIVREAVAQFLAEKAPSIGRTIARRAVACGVRANAEGVVVDFKEIARVVIRAKENRA